MPLRSRLCLELPDWIEAHLPAGPLPDVEQRMKLVLELAAGNIDHETGGPFAAAVFDSAHRLVAAGVNLVTRSRCSSAHAEIVALSLAEQACNDYRLPRGHELVISAEPCAMCLGAIPWSGVDGIVTSATDADIRAIGFDEGSKPENWAAALERRGIRVRRNLLRQQGRAVLERYRARGGEIYNGHALSDGG
ncbi:MAG: nucleoside deaminase [Gammaproteobacteria bacterium]|nr:MAG: nucleoside deaminase [Gammaproteobacteria bacterium]